MHLFDYSDGEYLLCSSFEAEIQGDAEADFIYYYAQFFRLKPTRQQVEMFYSFFVPAIGHLPGTLLAGALKEIAFEGEIRL